MPDEFARYDYAWKTSGWTVQNPTLTVVSPDTYYDPGLPEDVSKVLVTGEFLDWSTGRALEGYLTVRTSEILKHVPTNSLVMPGEKRLRFIKGSFSVLLPATDDPQLVPNDWTYLFRLTVAGHTQEFTAALPSSPDTVNIIDLTPDPVV